MRVTELKEPGALASWLADTAREGQDTVALDLEWIPRNGRDDEVYSGAVSGPTANDIGFFGAASLPELMQAPEGMTFVMHYASSDLKHLAWAGVPLHEKYPYQDTLILAHLLQESGEHSLGALVMEHYADDYKTIFKSRYKLPQDAPADENKIYNAKDTHYTRRLYDLLNSGLQADGIPQSLVEHVHTLQKALLETEIRGVAVDRTYLVEKGIQLKTKIETLVPAMRNAAKDAIEIIECEQWVKEIESYKTLARRAKVEKPQFNFESSPQLMDLLYNKLGLPVQKSEKTKKPSADFDCLEKIKDQHPLVEILQQYREVQKLYGTYVEGTLNKIIDGRIYPTLNVCGTTTGRISHSNPNLGNMPRDAGLRGMFVPDPGFVFVTADYAALEVYIEAHFTQDPNLLKIVNEGASKHDITLAGLAEFKIDRNTAKTINFASAYFCSHFKIAKILGVSNEKGKEVYDKYWEQYSGSLVLKKQTDEMVDRGEPIINPFGRKRRFEVKKRKEWDGDYRAAYNARIQGTGSDCMSWAFYTVDSKLKELGWGRGILTVHDEGIMMVKKEFAEPAAKLLVDTMEEAGRVAKLAVTLKAEPCIMEDRWQD